MKPKRKDDDQPELSFDAPPPPPPPRILPPPPPPDDEGDDKPIESFPARKTDPIGSQKSAERKKSHDVANFGRKTHKGRLLEVFHSARAKGLLLTDTEAATLVMGDNAAPGPFQGCRRRCTDLRDAKYIVAVEGEEHPNIDTPDDAMVCQITDDGEIAYARMIETGRTKKRK